MSRDSIHPITRALATALALIAFTLSVSAQDRLSDKDIQALMNNLKNDTKSFRPQFNNAVHKSIIRKTSREKDAKALVQTFENQTNALLENFKKSKKADGLPATLDTSDQIEKLINELKLDAVTSSWQKIRAELNQLSTAFGIARPPSQSASDPSLGRPACTDAVGAERAKRLVEECLQVSPATHPPCNEQNSCELIISEIKRSCALIGQTAPGFCSEYQ